MGIAGGKPSKAAEQRPSWLVVSVIGFYIQHRRLVRQVGEIGGRRDGQGHHPLRMWAKPNITLDRPACQPGRCGTRPGSPNGPVKGVATGKG